MELIQRCCLIQRGCRWHFCCFLPPYRRPKENSGSPANTLFSARTTRHHRSFPAIAPRVTRLIWGGSPTTSDPIPNRSDVVVLVVASFLPKTGTHFSARCQEKFAPRTVGYRRVPISRFRARRHPSRQPAIAGDVDLFFKDETTHPSGSLKHRLARSLFLMRSATAVREGTTIIEGVAGSTAISRAISPGCSACLLSP